MPQFIIRYATLLTAALVILSSVAHAFVSLATTIFERTTKNYSFSVGLVSPTTNARPKPTPLFMSDVSNVIDGKLSILLEKPLGLILEENDGSNPAFGPGGVIVTQVNEGGSAFDSQYASQLIQSKICTVMGKDVSASSFDEVMDEIIGAPSPLDVEFALSASAVAELTGKGVKSYDDGAKVSITVQQPDKPDIVIDGRVGDNLRKTLLANDVEVYRGLKKKLGNCGGGGQCGFCAVELTDEEGVWGERSDYEAKKIGKNGSENARLACLNDITGPATVRTL